MKKTYSELIKLENFNDRLNYLYIGNKIGDETFGSSRLLNQTFYRSYEWLQTRKYIIARDNGCDLGVDGCDLTSRNILVHHINPISEYDIINRSECLFDPENLISVSLMSHNFIHYGTKPEEVFVERSRNDMSPWIK